MICRKRLCGIEIRGNQKDRLTLTDAEYPGGIHNTRGACLFAIWLRWFGFFSPCVLCVRVVQKIQIRLATWQKSYALRGWSYFWGGLATEILVQPPKYKTHWQDICAILPVYLSDGTNGTEITYLDGTVEQMDKRLCWVLNDLLFRLRSSTSVLMRQSRMVLGKTARRVPLVLKKEFSLVPVKGRERIGEYDSQTGYVVLNHVKRLIADNSGVRICFENNVSVHVLDTSYTLWHNMQIAEAMREKLSAWEIKMQE